MKTQETWNKGQRVGQKPPLSAEQVQLIKMLLSQAGSLRDIALFSLAIDSSLRGCDLVRMKARDIAEGGIVLDRASILQQKTKAPVSFTMSPYTREAIKELIETDSKAPSDFLFTGQKGKNSPISPTHYRRLVTKWLGQAGLNSKLYGSHSLRRTKVALVYKKTGNIRAIQILLGHKSIENTKNYLGIDQDEALSISENFHNLF